MTSGIKRDGWSLERRLYEAHRLGLPLQLTAAEVDELVGPDDAIQTRIMNAAAQEAGTEEPGESGGFFRGLTWHQLKCEFAKFADK